MSRLRDSIQDLHDQAQDTAPLDAILSRSITQPEYTAVLGRLYGFTVPLETLLDRSLRGFELNHPYSDLMRAPDLYKDLIYFGVTGNELRNMPQARLPSTLELPAALGMLYLMEGSRLGGIIIARNLEDCLGLGPDCGTAYFSSYGKDPHALKDDFDRQLVSWVAMTREDDAVINGARDGFAALIAWMNAMERSH
ncbi:hypothetical protein DPQ33_00270 [Oceanidesulfovibrio indonesiensis]|uniref:Heme oxygenase n=2 Tax=Oceanidesulfovibrio indonesiensis TaxID=54767 RepID=A0A7M3MJE9_9BACT|nr:hypothetical protein DPQ33_00270 [Oceanidesulfovibrio indonesiensis]